MPGVVVFPALWADPGLEMILNHFTEDACQE